MKPYLTAHARERFDERFSGKDIQAEFAAAVPYGPTFGNSAYLLSPCGAVFAISRNAVATVLTKSQAMANIQVSFPSVKSEAVASRPAPVVNTEALVIEVAIEHARDDHEAGRENNKRDRARRNTLLRQEFNICARLQSVYDNKYFAERKRLASQAVSV